MYKGKSLQVPEHSTVGVCKHVNKIAHSKVKMEYKHVLSKLSVLNTLEYLVKHNFLRHF